LDWRAPAPSLPKLQSATEPPSRTPAEATRFLGVRIAVSPIGDEPRAERLNVELAGEPDVSAGAFSALAACNASNVRYHCWSCRAATRTRRWGFQSGSRRWPRIRDEALIQPPRQRVLAARMHQPMGDQPEAPLGHLRAARVRDDVPEAHLRPERLGHRDGPVGQGFRDPDRPADGRRRGRREELRAQQADNRIKVRGLDVRPAEIGHRPLANACPS
jgi:hypothetical protein